MGISSPKKKIKGFAKGSQKDSQAGIGGASLVPVGVFGRNNTPEDGDEIVERSNLPFSQFLHPSNSREEVFGMDFGDETVSSGSFALSNEHSGGTRRSSSPGSSDMNVDLSLGYNHSQEQIDKYVELYHRPLSSISSTSNDVENRMTQAQEEKPQYAKIFKSSPKSSFSATNSSSSSGRPLLQERNTTTQVPVTSFGTFDSRVHKDDDFNDHGHLRRNNNVKDNYGPTSSGASSNESFMGGTSLSPIVSDYSESTDSFPRGHTEILPQETPFMSKNQVRDQVIGKRLRNINPSQPKLERVREDVIEPGPREIRDNFYKLENIGDRTSEISTMSSDTDSLFMAPGHHWSSLTVGSTQSIEIGYWKVKPIDSQLNISVEKANNVSPR